MKMSQNKGEMKREPIDSCWSKRNCKHTIMKLIIQKRRQIKKIFIIKTLGHLKFYERILWMKFYGCFTTTGNLTSGY